jgi:hypothetical protein
MQSAKRVLSEQRGLLIGLGMTIAAAVLTLALPVPAQAFGCGVEAQYFSDPGKTNLVGVVGRTTDECGCSFYSWGSVTAYRTFVDPYC